MLPEKIKSAHASPLTNSDSFMAGGSNRTLKKILPIMKAYSSQITHMGDIGTGQITKLCNQIIVATNVLAIAETICFADACGIGGQKLSHALAGGLADSKLLQIFAPRMTNPSPEKTGALATMLKDINTVLDVGTDASLSLPITNVVQQLMNKGIHSEGNTPDLWEVIKIYKELQMEKSLRK